MASTAPRRIDSHLLAMAKSSGALFHRSGTEQLEHWANLGAAVESALGLPTVAKLKALARVPNIDALIAQAGTRAGNRKLEQFLKKQAFPQYGSNPEDPDQMVMRTQNASRPPKPRSRGGIASDADL